jgi:hypothetical protein
MVEHEGDFLWYVQTRHNGVFILKEVAGNRIKAAQKRAEMSDMVEEATISESLVQPRMGEFDIAKLPGGDLMRLKYAVAKMYSLDDFLSLAEASSSKTG